MKRRTILKAAIGGAVLGGGAWWAARDGLREFSTAGIAFGTTVSLRVLHADEQVAHDALAAAMTALHDIDRLMSLYRRDSQLSQLNRAGELASPDARFVEVLRAAQATSQLTGGAFDATVQPLWDAAVEQADPKRALARVDWHKLEVGDDRVRLHGHGMAVTLNGIAQGYGVDAALAALRAHGITHALLDTGEFRTLGRRDDGEPWTLAVRDPRDEKKSAHVLPADGRALATSGDYATTFTGDFSQHHIFDPRTGKSPQELASVSVLAPTGLQADALSTAFMVMGADRSLQLARSLERVDLLCIAKTGAVRRTAGFPASLV